MPANGYDLSGRQFGRWHVIRQVEKRTKCSNRIWECRCECGKVCPVQSSQLVQKKSTQCRSCVNRGREGKKNRLSHKWKGCGEIHGHVWKHVARGAEARGHSVSITIEYAWSLFLSQNRRYALSGLPIQFSRTIKARSERTASLDRIDSSKGYIEGNVQWVHRDINLMKQKFSQAHFVAFCKAVADHNSK